MNAIRNSLAQNLISLHRDLARRDGRWEICSGRNIDPSHAVGRELGGYSKRMDDCASSFQAAFPNQTRLISELNTGARELSRLQGAIQKMAENDTNYGSSWGKTLDNEIAMVGRAIDVVIGIKS